MYKLKTKHDYIKLIAILATLVLICMSVILLINRHNENTLKIAANDGEIKALGRNELEIEKSPLNIELKSDATEIKVGQPIEIKIYVTGGNISYFDGYLDYNQDEFETFSRGNIKINTKLTQDDDTYGMWGKNYDTTRKLVSISENYGDNYKIPDDGYLGSIQLTPKKNMETTKITLTDLSVVDKDGINVIMKELSIDIPKPLISYTITYDDNVDDDSVQSMPANGKKNQNEDYTIQGTPTRKGYTFKGWNTDKGGNGTSYQPGDTYNGNANLELYAKWERKTSQLFVNPNGGVWNSKSSTQKFTEQSGETKDIPNPTSGPNGYTVKFNANGGQEDNLQITQTKKFKNWTKDGDGTLNGTLFTFGETDTTLTANYEGESITLPGATKTGATFKGWFTSAVGGNKVGDAGTSYTPDRDNITLFAQWDEIQYKLIIDPDEGTYNGETTIYGAYNSTIPVKKPTPPKGFTVRLNNEGQISEVVQTKKFVEWVKTGKGNLDDMVYTFEDGDGRLTAKYIDNDVELGTPSRPGYKFDGWYTLPSGGEKIESPYKPESDITLYARWTPNKYTITFDAGDDATVYPTTKEVTYDQPYGELPTPNRPGHTFKGWYYKGQLVTDKDTVKITDNVTLTAYWEGETYTLTIDPNGGTYDGKKEKTILDGQYEQEVEIQDPVAPDGYKVTLFRNDGTEDKQEIMQEIEFTEWTKGEKGTLENNIYTFGDGNGTLTAQYEKKSVDLPQIERTGYEFLGWFTDPTGGEKKEDTFTPTSDITLYAHWEAKKFKLKFEPGPGAEELEEKDKEKEVTYGEKYGDLPTPKKDGYIFEGWYDGENRINPEDDVDITEDKTLTAKWGKVKAMLRVNPNGGEWEGSREPQEFIEEYGEVKDIPDPTTNRDGFTVTFDKCDGSARTQVTQTTTFERWELDGDGKFENKKYTFEEANGTLTAIYKGDEVELEQPERPGYDFDCWYTDTGVEVREDSFTPEKDTLLHAHWKPKHYNVTFETGSEDAILDEDQKTKEVTHGDKYGTLPEPTRPGYEFNGWYDEDGNRITEDNIVDITDDTTLTAKWLGATFTVYFDYREGTGITAKKEVRNEGTYGELPRATRKGYTFVGWYNPEEKLVTESTIVDLTDDITLHAKYKVNEYTITYENLMDSDNSQNPKKYTIEDKGPLTLYNLPDKDGYTFLGWYTTNDENGEKVTSIDTSNLGNITLYARWEKEDDLYLRSEKYKVGEKDIDNYEQGDIYLDKIEPETTVAELIRNCETNGTMVVLDSRGNPVPENSLVGTGMTIKVTKDNKEIRLTAVVMGDLDGNGKVTISDFATINKVLAKLTTLEGAEFLAADLDDNKDITISDFATINKVLAKLTTLTYTKKKN